MSARGLFALLVAVVCGAVGVLSMLVAVWLELAAVAVRLSGENERGSLLSAKYD